MVLDRPLERKLHLGLGLGLAVLVFKSVTDLEVVHSVLVLNLKFVWLGGVTVGASDVRSSGRGSIPGRALSSCLGQLSLPSLWGR